MKRTWFLALLLTACASHPPLTHVTTVDPPGLAQDEQPPLGPVRIVERRNLNQCTFAKPTGWNRNVVNGQTVWLPIENVWTDPCDKPSR